MPRERTQQLKEERAAQEAAEAEAAESTDASSSESTGTTSTGSRESSNYSSNTKFTDSKFNGDGYGGKAYYDGRIYHNGSFGRDFVISNELFTNDEYDYKSVPAMGEIVKKYATDSFTTEGEGNSITSALETLESINNGVKAAGYFYDVYDGAEQVMMGENGIVANMEMFKQAKMNMDENYIEEATGLYNDDLEKAKNLQYKKYLEDTCKAYNESNDRKVVGLKLAYEQAQYTETYDPNTGVTTTTKDGYYPTGYTEYNEYGYFDENSGWVAETPIRPNVPNYADVDSEWPIGDGSAAQNVVQEKVYDQIDYQFLIEDWNGIIDTIFNNVDSLEKRLKVRSVSFEPLEERPANSYYGGSGS